MTLEYAVNIPLEDDIRNAVLKKVVTISSDDECRICEEISLRRAWDIARRYGHAFLDGGACGYDGACYFRFVVVERSGRVILLEVICYNARCIELGSITLIENLFL